MSDFPFREGAFAGTAFEASAFNVEHLWVVDLPPWGPGIAAPDRDLWVKIDPTPEPE